MISTMPTRPWPALLLASTLALAGACKESGNDAYAEALRLLGEAERGPCQMKADKTGNFTVDVASINECMTKTKEALAQLEHAKQLGVSGREIDDLIAQTEDELRKLEMMHKTVLRMKQPRVDL